MPDARPITYREAAAELGISELTALFPKPTRRALEQLLHRLMNSRYAPFVRRAQLSEATSLPNEKEFDWRLVRLRYYLAEPDEPSPEVERRLLLIAELYRALILFPKELSAVQLERKVQPILDSLATEAPELRPLVYSLAELFALVGENSPEAPPYLHKLLRQQRAVWQRRLRNYWYAVLG